MLLKIVEVVKLSVEKYDLKKQEMIRDFETKSNLLNDLVLQAEDLTKKIEEKMKEENVEGF